MSLKKKILQSNWISAIITQAVKSYIWIVFKTSKLNIQIDNSAQELITKKVPSILLCWHSRILIMPLLLKRFGDFYAVVSQHSDGSYLSRFIEAYGHKVIRGSSSKGALNALLGVRSAIRVGKNVVITPDGPRGPKEKISSNVAGIINKLSVAGISITYSSSCCITLNSWDNFLVPTPFSSIVVLINKIDSIDNTSIEYCMVDQMRKASDFLAQKNFNEIS